MQSNPSEPPNTFQVERILQRGHAEGQRYYLVKWKGYSDAEASWEPESNLGGCRLAIDEFEKIVKRIDQENQKCQSVKKGRTKRGQKKSSSPIDGSVGEVDKAHPSEERKRGRASHRKVNGLSQSQSKDFCEASKNQGYTKQEHQEVESSKELNQFLTSESSELDATTAQTVAIMREPEKALPKEPSSKCKQIKQEKIESVKLGLDDVLKLDHNQMMNIKPEMMVDQCQKAPQFEVTQKTEHINQVKNEKGIGLSEKIQIQNFEGESEKEQKKLDLKIKSQFSQSHIIQNQKKQQNRQKKQIKSLEIQSAYSHRQELCEEELLELKIEMVEMLGSCLKVGKNTKYHKKIVKNQEKIRRYFGYFIDLSTSECLDFNTQIFQKVLTKNEALKLDEEGQFLYSRIDCLIRGMEKKDGIFSRTWLCALRDREKDERVSGQNDGWKYLVRVDDLREDLWKKLFRKFTMMKDE